jgi:hypothetical protein
MIPSLIDNFTLSSLSTRNRNFKMPQLQLPMFPVGVTHITALLAFIKEDGNITYFNGSLPVFSA